MRISLKDKYKYVLNVRNKSSLMRHPTAGASGRRIGTLVDSARRNTNVSGHCERCTAVCGKSRSHLIKRDVSCKGSGPLWFLGRTGVSSPNGIDERTVKISVYPRIFCGKYSIF